MLILNQSDIDNVFTMPDAIKAAKKALNLHASGEAYAPMRTHISHPLHQAQSLFMPAYSETLAAIGIKIVGIFPHNKAQNKPAVLAQMILSDGNSGEVCAILDGTHLTRLRTGAVQGLACDLLARKDAKVAALIGTGAAAHKQLEALLNVRHLTEVKICGTDFSRTQQFVATMEKYFSHFNTELIAVKNSAEAISNADIIVTATTSTRPVFDAKLVREGTHISGMGSFTPAMQELPELIIQRAGKIFFDTKEGVLAEAGDFIIPLNAGNWSEDKLTGELGQLIQNIVPGRESSEEITLFKSVGTAVLDLVTASIIYQKALAEGIGKKVEL